MGDFVLRLTIFAAGLFVFLSALFNWKLMDKDPDSDGDAKLHNFFYDLFGRKAFRMIMGAAGLFLMIAVFVWRGPR